MRILFLGGTGMLGPHIINQLLDDTASASHEPVDITIMHRGQRPYDYGNRVHTIAGDRSDFDHGLDGIIDRINGGERWDAVIDTASVNTWVDHSTRIFKDAADRYIYISSLSVYADNATPGQDESAPLATMPDEIARTIVNLPYDMQYYGAVKARSERAAAEVHFPERSLILRPGLLIGPRDTTHRFTYWPWRIREGGEVLTPGSPDDPVQLIDVRDFADFIVHGLHTGLTGTFNVNGPVMRADDDNVPDANAAHFTIGAMLETCRHTIGPAGTTFTWADHAWLQEHEVHMWAQMPVWIPANPETAGFHTRDLTRAIAAGLRTRPLSDSVRDTLDWFDHDFLPAHLAREHEQPQQTPADASEVVEAPAFSFGGSRPGLTRERERELLNLWRHRG